MGEIVSDDRRGFSIPIDYAFSFPLLVLCLDTDATMD